MSISEKEENWTLTEIGEKKLKIFSELFFFISSGQCDSKKFVFS